MTTATANDIPVKQAIRLSIDFVQTAYAETGTLIADLALEEIQPTDDGEWWHVTVGFFRPRMSDVIKPGRSLRKKGQDRHDGD